MSLAAENEFVLGVDGGGTKTEWVLVDSQRGNVIRSGTLSGSNMRLLSDQQLEQIFSCLDTNQVKCAGVFLAGCATDHDKIRLEKLLRRIWPGAAELRIGGDSESAIAAAFRNDDGIVVIAGTGAIVIGRNSGIVEKAGGWGHVLGDRGSGYDLVRDAVRIALKKYDLKRELSLLLVHVMRDLAVNSVHEVAAWITAADKMSVSRLAKFVFMEKEDPEVLKVIQEKANELAECVIAVCERLKMDQPVVKLRGGIFAHQTLYQNLVKESVQGKFPNAKVEVCTESAAVGAAWLAKNFSLSAVKAQPETLRTDKKDLAKATTELSNQNSAHLDEMSSLEIVELFIKEENCITQALESCKNDLSNAVELVSKQMVAGGKLYYTGAGTSGRLGVLDASEIPPTFGAPPELVQGIIAGGVRALHSAVEGAEDQKEAGALAISERGVKAGDIVCGITASGGAPFVIGSLEQGRKLGAKTILVTCNAARQKSNWDVEIDLPTGPEIVTGSTRLKAGTATKVTLNMLSTSAMVRCGRVKGNKMIDLGVSNEKLRVRGARIVAESLNIPYESAFERLKSFNWNVRACLQDHTE
jgi:N-acetylmuramic acid 6-phosphate etherase